MFQRYLDFTNRITDRLFNNWSESFDGVAGGYILSVVNVLIILVFVAVTLGFLLIIFSLPVHLYVFLIDKQNQKTIPIITKIKKIENLETTEDIDSDETKRLQEQLSHMETKLKRGIVYYVIFLSTVYVPLVIPLLLIGLDIVLRIGIITAWLSVSLVISIVIYIWTNMYYCYQNRRIVAKYYHTYKETDIETIFEMIRNDLPEFLLISILVTFVSFLALLMFYILPNMQGY